MSTNVTFNGVVYPIPTQGDQKWAPPLDRYLVALSAGTLQPTGGLFTLTSDVNFGPNFGLLSKYFTSINSLPATSGLIRLTKTDTIDWRNNANSGDNVLAVNASDQLAYNGGIIATGLNTLADGTIWIGSSGNLPVAQTLSGDITVTDLGVTSIGAQKISNSQISNLAAIAYTKLNLTGSIVNSDIYSAAAIAYSKLSLTNSILNADINSTAAIAYSKLSLTGSIVNADIATAAAIAFSKLAVLNNSIVPVTNGSGVIISSTTTATQLGYLDATSSIQTQLNGKQSTLTIGNLTDVGTDGITVTGGTGAVIGSGTSLSQHVADTTHNGYLSSTDWNTFNGKQAAFSGLTTNGVIYATSATAEASTAAGTTGQFLQANTGAAPTWGTPSGSGTVNSGTTPLLAYYKTSTNAVSNVDADASMDSNKITNLKNGTGAQDAAAFGQIYYGGQIAVQTTSSTAVTTTSSTFTAATGQSLTITPTTNTRRIKITVSTVAKTAVVANSSCLITLKRGSTELSGSSFGFILIDVGSFTSASFTYIDSPASTSTLTYAVYFANGDNVTTVSIGNSSSTSTIIAEEIV